MDESEILQRFAAFERRIAELESELAQHRQAPSAAPAAPVPAAPITPDRLARRALSRRGLIGGGAAAAAAGAAGLVAGAPQAAAVDGANLVLGTYTNTAVGATAIVVTGNPGYGFGSIDTSYGGSFGLFRPALFGYAAGAACNLGGFFDSAADGGVGAVGGSAGTGGVGVLASAAGVDGVGLIATSQEPTGTGALVAGDHASLRITSYSTRAAPTGDTAAHSSGDVVEDSDGNLWLCTGSGTPGTWRKLAGPETAGALHLLPRPVRVYDSRTGASPHVAPQTPLVANTPRTLDLKVNSSGVPAGATAAFVTCLVVGATPGNGNLTLWANGVAKPSSNTMVWGGTSGRASTLALTALDANARVQVSASVATDFVLDVVAYLR